MAVNNFIFLSALVFSIGAAQFVKDPICPCVRPNGSSICFSYDPHYQAVDLSEAVVNFVHPALQTPPQSTNDTSVNVSCISEHMKRFGKRRGLQNLNATIIANIKQICSSKKPSKPATSNENDSGSHEQQRRERKRLRNGSREKRQTVTSESPSTVNVDCRKKAEPVSSETDLCGLCDVCWQWVVLNSTYFPPVINQMACGNDTSCLTGNGACKHRYRVVKILHNLGTDAIPNWIEENMNVPMACDCQVSPSSAVFTLVKN